MLATLPVQLDLDTVVYNTMQYSYSHDFYECCFKVKNLDLNTVDDASLNAIMYCINAQILRRFKIHNFFCEINVANSEDLAFELKTSDHVINKFEVTKERVSDIFNTLSIEKP